MTDTEKLLADAIKALLGDYRTDGCPDPKCTICAESNAAKTQALEALKIAGAS